ncbi:MAG: AAA family ATPase, partial [Clostridia bacterium]|nr:AAA family ATPase [Clostridia bacterium]
EAMGHGRIYLSLSGEMSVRLRGQLSVVFPGVCVDETEKRPDGEDDAVCFPDRLFLKSVRILFRTLTYGCAGDAPSSSKGTGQGKGIEEMLDDADFFGGDDGDDFFDEGGEDDEKDSFTPIEELELCVRAYNSLRRAGIDSVEKLRGMKEEEIVRLRNMGVKAARDVIEKVKEYDRIHGVKKSAKAEKEKHEDQVRKGMTLDDLIGLENVKEQVRKITAYARMKKDFESAGTGAPDISLNMEFVGNPGTAKTTVARIVARFFREIGLLTRDEVIEVGRSDLVAKYVGNTAPKVREAFERAKGGVLFIDEAYSLLDEKEGLFGDEAINTIVQEMENHRDDTVVIFAGYPDKMKRFFSRNPGLRSRVPFRLEFCDYTADEMVLITKAEAGRRGFAVAPDADEKVRALCDAATKNDESGNGRFCRNLAECAILDYAQRVYGNEDSKAEKNMTLIAEDFIAPAGSGSNSNERPVIGFGA